jgi:hypothetical protein
MRKGQTSGGGSTLEGRSRIGRENASRKRKRKKRKKKRKERQKQQQRKRCFFSLTAVISIGRVAANRCRRAAGSSPSAVSAPLRTSSAVDTDRIAESRREPEHNHIRAPSDRASRVAIIAHQSTSQAQQALTVAVDDVKAAV